MKFAVVGGGWAGMAAADTLVRAGHKVTVFELSHQLGGRARGLNDPALGRIDNGQHLLIGAYAQTLALIARAHGKLSNTAQAVVRQSTAHQPTVIPPILRQPLSLRSADGSIRLNMPSWPCGSLGRLIALASAQGLSLSDRWQAARLLAGIRLGNAWPDNRQTVSQWLDQHGQSESLQLALWIPLCLATMNTSAQAASAQLFARVLKDSLLSADPGATDLIIPTCDLTELWIDAVAAQVEVVYGTRVQRVTPSPLVDAAKFTDADTDAGRGAARGVDRGAYIDAEKFGTQVEIESRLFDGCVIATPPSGALQIVRNWIKNTSTDAGAGAGANANASADTSADRDTEPDADASINSRVYNNAPVARRLLKTLGAFEFLPITTCYMELSSPLRLPYPMLMLRSGHRPCHDRSAGPGQWVFDRNTIDTSLQSPARLAFVISHAGKEALDRDTLPEILLQQLLEELATQPPRSPQGTAQSASGIREPGIQKTLEIRASRIITDKRATFAATPGLERPGVHTDWPSIKLAGDWTDTGYPAVLEGAVMSGITAANALLKSISA